MVQKSPITIEPEIKDPIPRKTRRSSHVTACLDQRRMDGHCGICGSKDLVTQGVRWCTNCGAEEETLHIGIYHWRWKEDAPLCTCNRKWLGYNSKGEILVTKCLTCGAVEGPKCPACRKALWNRTIKRRCQRCGFNGDVK